MHRMCEWRGAQGCAESGRGDLFFVLGTAHQSPLARRVAGAHTCAHERSTGTHAQRRTYRDARCDARDRRAGHSPHEHHEVSGCRNAYDDPTNWGGADGANLAVWRTMALLFEGTMRGLFTVLFGAGALLFLERHAARSPDLRPADLYFRRTMWLIVFGLLQRLRAAMGRRYSFLLRRDRIAAVRVPQPDAAATHRVRGCGAGVANGGDDF